MICFTHELSRAIEENIVTRDLQGARCFDAMEIDRELFTAGQKRRLEQAHLSMPGSMAEGNV